MKITLLVAVWRRLETTELCYKGIQRLILQAAERGATLQPLIIISEAQHATLAEKYEFDYISAVNNPLGAKMNTGLRAALEENFDYLMQLGSDDFISRKGFNLLLDAMFENKVAFGFKDIYIGSIETGEVRLVETTQVFGAGRCIRRDVLEKAAHLSLVLPDEDVQTPFERFEKGVPAWIPTHTLPNYQHLKILKGSFFFKFWDNECDKGLDQNSELKIWRAGYGNFKAIKTSSPVVLDLKDGYNIHKYEKFIQYPLADIDAPFFKAFPEVPQLSAAL